MKKDMNEKLMECIANPLRFRLLVEIMKHGKTTAKYLSETCDDIPQTSLYRNLKRMTADGLLKIVSETQIRGTVEKTYELSFDMKDPQEILSQNSGSLYMQMFLQYILLFSKKFQSYCESPDIDIKKDMSGFSVNYVYATDEELKKAIQSISNILEPLQNNRPGKDRKLRDIGIIISPEQTQ